jgi:arylsulfatase
MKEWADKYKGKFDDGWEAYRERTYKRMMEQGLLPANTKLTPIPDGMDRWADIPESQKTIST